MNDPTPPGSTTSQLVLDRAVCSRCGCFCDDIFLCYDDDQLLDIQRACALGEAWLRQNRKLQPTAMIAGQAVDLEAAIDEAARLIDHADAPVVEGLTNITLEAAREAVLLARDISAALLPRPLPSRSFLRSGIDAPEFTATLGKVRTTADLVIFWRADPLRTHPRHLERYSFFAPLLNNRPRTLVVADNLEPHGDHLTAREATCCINLPSAFLTLEMFLSLKSVTHLKNDDGQATLENAQQLAQLIAQADHTHFFLGVEASEDQSICDALHGMAARARSEHHISVSNLAPPGNTWGVQELTTWMLGAPGPLWLTASGDNAIAPLHLCSTESTMNDAFDLSLNLGAELPGEETKRGPSTGDYPRIVLGPQHDTAANVSFALPGLDPRLHATVMRNDGIPLTLCGDASQGVADPAVAILQSLRKRVSSIGEPQR